MVDWALKTNYPSIQKNKSRLRLQLATGLNEAEQGENEKSIQREREREREGGAGRWYLGKAGGERGTERQGGESRREVALREKKYIGNSDLYQRI